MRVANFFSHPAICTGPVARLVQRPLPGVLGSSVGMSLLFLPVSRRYPVGTVGIRVLESVRFSLRVANFFSHPVLLPAASGSADPLCPSTCETPAAVGHLEPRTFLFPLCPSQQCCGSEMIFFYPDLTFQEILNPDPISDPT